MLRVFCHNVHEYIVTIPMKTQPTRMSPGERKAHFLSLWVEDVTVKPRLTAMAELEGRTMNNYFNHYVVPLIDGLLEKKLASLPKDMAAKIRNMQPTMR